MRGLILAAGLGTRLRPLTLHRPKPLCLFYGEPLLDLAFRQLRRAGLEQIAVNTHHLAGQIEAHVGLYPDVYSPPPHISYEPEILGTGGCIGRLREWIEGDHLLIYNGDIIADIDLRILIEQHLRRGADATMVLLDRHKAGSTPVFASEANLITQIGGRSPLRPATFSGVHIIGPALQSLIPAHGFHHIIDSYQELIKSGGKVDAFEHKGIWADLGAPEDYFSAHLTLLRSSDRLGAAERLGMRKQAPRIDWRDAEESATVGQEFSGRMHQSFVFGAVDTKDVQSLERCIVYPNSRLDQARALSHKIITPYGHFDL